VSILENIALIYLIIGAGNLGRHVVHCGGCKETIRRNGIFLFQAFESIGYWPVEIYQLWSNKRLMVVPQGQEVMEVTFEQKEGETEEEFQKRIMATMQKKHEEIMKQINGGKK
jgi:hypothetical protein